LGGWEHGEGGSIGRVKALSIGRVEALSIGRVGALIGRGGAWIGGSIE